MPTLELLCAASAPEASACLLCADAERALERYKESQRYALEADRFCKPRAVRISKSALQAVACFNQAVPWKVCSWLRLLAAQSLLSPRTWLTRKAAWASKHCKSSDLDTLSAYALRGLAAAQSILEALKQHLAPPRPQVIPGGPPGALPPQMMQQYAAEEDEVAGEGKVARTAWGINPALDDKLCCGSFLLRHQRESCDARDRVEMPVPCGGVRELQPDERG